MSNYHVLEVNDKKDAASVVFHIPVPDEVNSVGINLRVILKQYLADREIVPVMSWLQTDNPTEYAQIENGEVYEHSLQVRYNANETDLYKRDQIDAKYTSLVSIIPNIIRERFKFWGLNRDVT